MDLALWTLALSAMALGLLGLLLPLLPGAPLLLAGAWLAAWLDDYQRVSGWTVAVIALLALAAWAIDYLAAVLGVKKVGASKLAMLGAGLGVLAGFVFGPVGLVLGPVLGAAVGEYLARKDEVQAGKVGLAAGIAFVVAMALKFGIGLGMLALFAFAYFV